MALVSHGDHHGRIDGQNASGATALHVAAFAGFLHIVNLLLDHGSDIEAKDTLGNSVLHYAAYNGASQVGLDPRVRVRCQRAS